ncbi:MAG: hypothetical protein AAF654_03360 [Myxococcota bacterium]
MDEFERRLREDAEAIPAEISPDLERRITVSLEQIQPSKQEARSRSESPWLLWVLALAGAAVAVAVVELRGTTSDAPDLLRPASVAETLSRAPAVLDPKQATNALLGPLAGELDALRADLQGVKDRLRDDIGL